jgi:hypothetical protein
VRDVNCRHCELCPGKNVAEINCTQHWADYRAYTTISLLLGQVECYPELLQSVPTIRRRDENTIRFKWLIESSKSLLDLVDPMHRHVAYNQIELALLELFKPLSFLVDNDWYDFVWDIGALFLIEPILYSLGDNVVRLLDGKLWRLAEVKFLYLVLLGHVVQKEVRVGSDESDSLEVLLDSLQTIE